MNRRPIGRSGLAAAPLAFGGNVFGWTVDEPTAFRLLDAFVDGGFNLVDTADVYSSWVPGNHGGESETIIGRWIRATGRRDDILVASKVGMELPSGAKGLSRDHIERSIRASLTRLQTDHVDLYQSHVDDPETPLEEPLHAYAGLLSAGKVRAIGASNFSAARLAASLAASSARGLPRYESMQPKYNLLERDEYEGDLEETCRSGGLGVLTYLSLAGGFLSGKYRSAADLGKSPRGKRMERRLTDQGRRMLAALDSISQRLDVAPSSVAIAWNISRPGVTAAIASATSLDQLRELMDGATLQLDVAAREQLYEAGA